MQVEVAKLIEKAGASAIAVHGRTRSQMYEGHAIGQLLKRLKKQFLFLLLEMVILEV